ncbi:MAG: penicillin-binding transpeptidase domain-containing protein [Candidatus Carbobacillus sp.]|nr:penicillin-binding transpeptidase domain-containing protein [Candidatus Carbobacillus sp.]
MVKRAALRAFFVVMTTFMVMFLLLLGRLYYLQTFARDDLQKKALAQWEKNSLLHAQRGTIYDRNLEPLAVDGPAYNVVAIVSPFADNHVIDPEQTAARLAPLLGMRESSILKALLRNDVYQVELRPGGWKISEDIKEQIEALKLPGIVLLPEQKRYYPNGAFLSHTLGYVDKDGVPRMGLEAYWDDQLKGVDGRVNYLKDRTNQLLPDGTLSFSPAIDGSDLMLTIDAHIQQYVERALDESDVTMPAERKTVIVADPKTMDVLALASRPNFDPNRYWEVESYMNLPIAYTYEPGSTFKTVTLAAAIEEGVFHPEETYQAGIYNSPKIRPPIRDYTTNKGWGEITFAKGFVRSSNVAMTILGYERLGAERLFRYIQDFGFGAKTGIELPGEASGRLPSPYAPPRDIATMTFGQGITVTPLQLTAAVAAAINGGVYHPPRIVKATRAHDVEHATWIDRPLPPSHRVIQDTSSALVRTLMGEVVRDPDGTGRAYAIPGYTIGGKTGTAQKLGPDGQYLKDNNVFSFIGFAPLEDPKVLILVVVDEPAVRATSSAEVVAPIFKKVMEDVLTYLGIPKDEADHPSDVQAQGTAQVSDQDAGQKNDILPTNDGQQRLTPLPDVRGLKKTEALQQLKKAGWMVMMAGEGETVKATIPAPNTPLIRGATVVLLGGEVKTLPDFSGLSLREAVTLLEALDLPYVLDGEGFVIRQEPQAGTPLSNDRPVVVTLVLKGSGQGDAQVDPSSSDPSSPSP